jgi:adenosylhomocysteine nucleosidase
MSWRHSFLLLLPLSVSVFPDSVALFYALDADLREAQKQIQPIGQPVLVGGRKIHRMQIGPHTVFSVKMGSGPVETAVSAQALLARFRCDWAFSVGPAGALTEDLPIGAWYRLASVAAWQRGTAGATGFLPAQSSRWTFNWNRFPLDVTSHPAVGLPLISLASGELFIASRDERERVHAVTDAHAIDMNTFGLAVACQDHGVPLFAWRVISDAADETASEAFREFAAQYAGEGGRLAAELISRLPPNPADPDSYPELRRWLRPGEQESGSRLPMDSFEPGAPPPPRVPASPQGSRDGGD